MEGRANGVATSVGEGSADGGGMSEHFASAAGRRGGKSQVSARKNDLQKWRRDLKWETEDMQKNVVAANATVAFIAGDHAGMPGGHAAIISAMPRFSAELIQPPLI
jgi:hypothetical protein